MARTPTPTPSRRISPRPKSDLLLLDCLNPNHKSDDLICDIRESVPHIRVVLFGMDEDADIFLQAVRLGVNGYVLKSASSSELIDAVRAVAQGEAVCPSKFCKVLFQAISSEATQRTAIAEQRAGMRFELTQRQRQLMSLVAMGLSNKEIAANLNLSEFTVKNHIYRVMKQVDAQNRHEAVTLIRAGGPGSEPKAGSHCPATSTPRSADLAHFGTCGLAFFPNAPQYPAPLLSPTICAASSAGKYAE